MTPRQAEALAFVRQYTVEHNGVPPSFDEIREGLGLKSKSSVHRLVQGLVTRGHLRTEFRRRRSLAVLTPEQEANAVAVEHIRDRILSGVGFFQILAEIGVDPGPEVTEADVIEAVRQVWLTMQAKRGAA